MPPGCTPPVRVHLCRLSAAPPRDLRVVREDERELLVRDRLPQAHVEGPGVALKSDLLTAAHALEGITQQPRADEGVEVHPRVPAAQLDVELLARLVPRFQIHGGGARAPE